MNNNVDFRPTSVLMDNNLKMPSHKVGEMSSKVNAIRRGASPWGCSKGKQAMLYYDEAKS